MRYRHSRPDPILPLLAVAGIAALLVSFLRDRESGGHRPRGRGRPVAGGAALSRKVAREAEELDCATFVRPAGPSAMRDRPRRGWDRVDEQVDESFPASDPPGNY